MAASFPCRVFWGARLPVPKVRRNYDVICETDHLATASRSPGHSASTGATAGPLLRVHRARSPVRRGCAASGVHKFLDRRCKTPRGGEGSRSAANWIPPRLSRRGGDGPRRGGTGARHRQGQAQALGTGLQGRCAVSQHLMASGDQGEQLSGDRIAGRRPRQALSQQRNRWSPILPLDGDRAQVEQDERIIRTFGQLCTQNGLVAD